MPRFRRMDPALVKVGRERDRERAIAPYIEVLAGEWNVAGVVPLPDGMGFRRLRDLLHEAAKVHGKVIVVERDYEQRAAYWRVRGT